MTDSFTIQESAIKDNKHHNTATDYRFKFLYAIGIILIVAGHTTSGIDFFSKNFPYYAFHLALFVFCSGYFYKSTNENSVFVYILKKFKHLIIPLYLWNLFYALLVYLLGFKGFTIGGDVTFEKIFLTPILHGHQFEYNMGGWFVIPLVMVEVFTVIIRAIISKFKSINEYWFFTFCLVLGFLGVINAGHHNHDWGLVINRMLYFIPFFAFGILYKNKLEAIDKINNTFFFILIFTIQTFITLKYGSAPVSIPSWCKFSHGCLMPFVIAFLGIAFWYKIACILTPVIGKSRIINLIANNTYTIMINQFLGFMLIKTIYYVISQHTIYFNNFDIVQYKTNIWYYFMPKGVEQMGLLYLAAGLFIPILMQLAINKISMIFRKQILII